MFNASRTAAFAAALVVGAPSRYGFRDPCVERRHADAAPAAARGVLERSGQDRAHPPGVGDLGAGEVKRGKAYTREVVGLRLYTVKYCRWGPGGVSCGSYSGNDVLT